MVVEPDLAEGHRAVRVELGVQPGHRRIEIVAVLPGLVRMDADREPHRRPRGAHPPRPAPPPPRRPPTGSPARRPDPALAGARDDGVEIAGELLAGEVAVGVDHDGHGGRRWISGPRSCIRVPGGTS